MLAALLPKVFPGYQKPHPLMSWRNRLIWRNGRIDLLCPGLPDFTVQVESSARGGECGASTAVDCSATHGEGTGQADERRSLVLCPALPMVPFDPGRRHDHPSRDFAALASSGLPSLLELEIAAASRTAAGSGGSREQAMQWGWPRWAPLN